MNIPEPLFQTMLARKDLYIRHEQTFRRIFGISMWSFLDFLTGFDVVKFDDWLRTPDGTSTHDYLRQTYGSDAAELVKKLIKA